MAVPYYPGALYTPKLGLGLFGQDEVLAENFVILDSAFGGGSSINVNGTLVVSPNLNSTLPSAPAGKSNVIWQVDINGNVSAYASTASSAWATLTGDLTETQVIPFDGPTVGTPDTGISRLGAASLAIGNGTTGDLSGSLSLQTLTAVYAASTDNTVQVGIPAGGITCHLTYSNGVNLYTHSNSGFRAPTVSFYRSEGTQTTPSVLNAGDQLGYINFTGYDGSAYALGSQIQGQIGNQWSTSVHSSTIIFFACPAQSTALDEVFRMNSNPDNGGDVFGNISRLSMWVDTLNINTSVPQFMGFITGDGATTSAAFQSKAQGIMLLGTGTDGDFSATLKLEQLLSSYISLNPIVAPGAPVITNQGVQGLTTWTYVVVAKDIQGNTISSTSGSTTTGNATLSGTNYNVITISSPSSGAVSYDVYRTTAGTSPNTVGKIGNVVSGGVSGSFPIFNDTGIAASGSVPANTAAAIFKFSSDTGISRIGVANLALGNGSASDFSGSLKLTGLNNVGTYTDSTGAVGTSGQLLSSTVTGTVWTGAITVSATLTDGLSSTGTNGQVLSSTVTGVKWVTLAGTGTVTNTLGSLTQYAVVIGNGGADETVLSSLGSNGYVLTSNGAGSPPSWQSVPAASVAWSTITAAAANLTLANAGYTTTFNQTSAVAWTWANTTTATSGTTNASPLLELAANYWTGAASAADTWTIGSSLAAGTNGASTLTVAHSGSTGIALVSVPNLSVGAGSVTTPSLQVGTIGFFDGSGVPTVKASGTTLLRMYNGTTSSGNIQIANNTLYMFGTVSGQGAGLSGQILTQTNPSVVLGNGSTFTGTTGTQIGVSQGGVTGLLLSFAPSAASSSSFIVSQIVPTINATLHGANSGGYTALKLAVTETSLGSGTNRLIDCYAGTSGVTSEFYVDNVGNISAAGKVVNYAGIATVRNGIAAEYALSDLTAQSAAITATTLLSAPQTGMYKVSWSATITTASDISSVLGGTNGFQVIYTSPTDSVAKTTVSGNSVTSSANTTGTAVGGVEVIYAKTGTNIQFSYGYTDSHTSTAMVFELHISVEAL